jgi:hypothetical protein
MSAPTSHNTRDFIGGASALPSNPVVTPPYDGSELVRGYADVHEEDPREIKSPDKLDIAEFVRRSIQEIANTETIGYQDAPEDDPEPEFEITSITFTPDAIHAKVVPTDCVCGLCEEGVLINVSKLDDEDQADVATAFEAVSEVALDAYEENIENDGPLLTIIEIV